MWTQAINAHVPVASGQWNFAAHQKQNYHQTRESLAEQRGQPGGRRLSSRTEAYVEERAAESSDTQTTLGRFN
jgi:hypothetical protein